MKPTPARIAAELVIVREEVRRNADLLDHCGNTAAVGGALQASFRTLAAELRTGADRFIDPESLDPLYVRDIAAICILNLIINNGMQHAGATSRTLNEIMRSLEGTPDEY